MAEIGAKVGFLDGEFLPWKDCKVHMYMQVVRYGFRVFEGIRAYWNEDKKQLYVFRLHDHLNRLMDTGKLMRITIPYTKEEIAKIIVELFTRNEFRQDCYTQPSAYIGMGEVTSVTLGKDAVGFMAFAVPFDTSEKKEVVQKACTSSWRSLSDDSQPRRMKVGSNYLNVRLARLEAANGGYDTAILLTEQGKVSEGLIANLTMVRKGIPTIPPVTSDILEGITRSTLIHLLKEEMGLTTAERDIDRTELYVAEEVFLCGTGAEIAALGSIDGIPVGNGGIGPVAKRLRELYFGIVRGKNPKYMDWLTPVYKK